jgi:hypothetical protein
MEDMVNFYQFDDRWKRARGGWGLMPPAARAVVGVFALPGILLAILSLLLFAVSMLALLVLTVPVYRLLARLTGGGRGAVDSAAGYSVSSPFSVVFGTPVAGSPPVAPSGASSGTRHVDSTVVD